MRYYIYKGNTLFFESPLNESNYLISTDENDLDTHYVEITKERFDILNSPKIELVSTESIEDIQRTKINELDLFDKLGYINSFVLNDKSCWFDKQDRISILNAVKTYKNSGEYLYPLWTNNSRIMIQCDKLINILNKVEIYAVRCFNKTQEHKANIEKLNTKEEIEAYDFTTGYPEPLIFNTNEEVH